LGATGAATAAATGDATGVGFGFDGGTVVTVGGADSRTGAGVGAAAATVPVFGADTAAGAGFGAAGAVIGGALTGVAGTATGAGSGCVVGVLATVAVGAGFAGTNSIDKPLYRAKPSPATRHKRIATATNGPTQDDRSSDNGGFGGLPTDAAGFGATDGTPAGGDGAGVDAVDASLAGADVAAALAAGAGAAGLPLPGVHRAQVASASHSLWAEQ